MEWHLHRRTGAFREACLSVWTSHPSQLVHVKGNELNYSVAALVPRKQQGRITEFFCTVSEWYNSESLLKPDNVETCTKGLSWLFIASYFSLWVLTARCSHLGFICTKGVVIVSGGGRGPVRVKFWQVTRPWNSDTRLHEMNELHVAPPEKHPTPQTVKWLYSGSSSS